MVAKCGCKVTRKNPVSQLASSFLLPVVDKLLREDFQKNSLRYKRILKAPHCQTILERYHYIIPRAYR